ncbi:APC family permease [Adhaeribacter radiodurans]|uniref:Amino acid permease n=1 Tax=Adhaeribacter radiodurans TaxID=2745197 RepID=A0A7L7LCT1_9BACT|nr:amino acid permease [Adhaeribacter radiodurans]QMU30557.1 amino acid permease [Adhaeribacter radiodurans]
MAENSTGFKREIKLFDAIMIVTGGMIGSGIFIVSADIARLVGSAGWLLLVWLLAGFITIIAALSYGELSSMFPNVGGQYVYLREAYNKMVAFLYGWTLFLVIQTGVIAAVAMAFARFTGVFLPWFSETNVLFRVGGYPFTTVQLLAVGVLLLLNFINARGVKSGKWIANIFSSTKILALLALIVLGIAFGMDENVVQANFSNLWQAQQVTASSSTPVPLAGAGLLIAIGLAMIGSMFSSDCWNVIGFSGDEIINPKRTIVLSMVIGTIVVTVLYALVNIVYLLVLPLQGSPEGTTVLSRGIQFAADDRVGTAVAEAVGGPKATLFIAFLIMVSTFGCINTVMLSGARVYYTIARDGLFFPQLARLNKNGVPAIALYCQTAWACLLCVSGKYGDMLNYVMFSVLLFYIITIIGIFILRRTQPDRPRPYKAIGYPVIPAIYVILTSGICFVLLLFQPAYAGAGLILVGLGIPVYYIFRKQFKEIPVAN